MPQTEIRAIIIDDEALARQKLKKLLEREPNLRIIGDASDSTSAVEQLRTLRPDLVFLDIQLPGGSGFEVLKEASDSSNPYVIFTTAYDQYAVKAFDLHAVDYLLKPFDQERLHRAVEKVRGHIASRSGQRLAEHLAHLIERIPAEEKRRIVIKTEGRLVFLDLDDVEWIEAAANYVRIHCAGGTSHMVRNTLRDVEPRLDQGQFMRIHRSIIVNVKCIAELEPCNSNEYVVRLKSGKELSCSRSYHAALAAVIGERL